MPKRTTKKRPTPVEAAKSSTSRKTRKVQAKVSKAKLTNPAKIVRLEQSKIAGRSDSKKAKVLATLRSPSGATIDAMMKATGWQQHSIRGFLAGVIRKKLSLNLVSDSGDYGRVYRITGDAPGSQASAQPDQR